MEFWIEKCTILKETTEGLKLPNQESIKKLEKKEKMILSQY